jgi:putative aldouronate transport system substrate-binding protein
LDKAGITRLPETLEEHEAALYALVENGVHEYAFTPRLGDWVQGSFISIHGAYGSYPFFWIPTEDGSGVEWGGVSDRSRQAVEIIQRWWADGIINPESLTTKWKDLVNDWCQQRSGFVDCGTWYRLIPGGELYDCILDQGGTISHAWAPKGPEGKFGYPGWGHAGNSRYFGRQLADDDAKMRKILELEDTLKGDPYWATLVNYGKQGDHYYRDPELGLQRKKLEDLDVPVEKVGWQCLGYIYGQPIPDIWYSWQGSLLPQQIEKAFAGNTEWIPELGGFMDPDMCKEFTETGTTEDQWYVDFYSGAKDMSEWDSFVNAYMEAGGACNQENATEAYNNRQSILDSIKTKVNEIAG